MELALIVLGLAGFLVLLTIVAIPRTFFLSRRCRKNYRRWMQEQGLTEVSRDDRLLFKGPFSGMPGSGFTVFRAVFTEGAGVTRKAFLRCGDHGRGLLGHHDLDVRWDD